MGKPRGRPRTLTLDEEMLAVAEVDWVRFALKRWRERQSFRRYEARFTTVGPNIAAKRAEIRGWSLNRRRRAFKSRSSADRDTLGDLGAMLRERDPATGRPLGGVHVSGRDFHIQPATRRQAFEIAARRLSKRLGKKVTGRAVEAAYKSWRSWRKRQRDQPSKL